MLVRDPERRFTIASVKRHRWMQAEVPKEEQQRQQQQEEKSGRKCDVPINEGLLKVMGDLGIDINMTREVTFFIPLK